MSASPALDHVQAGAHGHHYTTTGLDHRKIAIWAFIGSECMLFASLISTYLIYKGRSVTGPFPPGGGGRARRARWPAGPIAGCPPGELFKPILNIPVTSQS